MKKYLEIGKVVGTRGLKGEVKIETWCDTPDFIKKFGKFYLDNGKKELKVISIKINKSIAIALIDGFDSIEKAEVLRGKILYIDRDDVKLEKGRYFIQDLIGLSVIDIDNKKEYGKISQVLQTGANDVYEVEDEKGKKYLVPVIPDVVIKIDVENSKVYIRPIKGIFEDEN